MVRQLASLEGCRLAPAPRRATGRARFRGTPRRAQSRSMREVRRVSGIARYTSSEQAMHAETYQ